MKKIFLITFVMIQFGIINAQDTIQHVVGDCIPETLKSASSDTCPNGIFFEHLDDTLIIYGRIWANCCGTHFAIVEKLYDTIHISTIDTGNLCTCTCPYCFEIKIPATIQDTIVEINNTIYNTKKTVNSIETNELENDLIKIIPNPINDYFELKADFQKIKSIWISDLSGRTIKKIKDSKNGSINIKSLETGIYLLNLETVNNKIITKKIMKN
jgi:hypothetical protein